MMNIMNYDEFWFPIGWSTSSTNVFAEALAYLLPFFGALLNVVAAIAGQVAAMVQHNDHRGM